MEKLENRRFAYHSCGDRRSRTTEASAIKKVFIRASGKEIP